MIIKFSDNLSKENKEYVMRVVTARFLHLASFVEDFDGNIIKCRYMDSIFDRDLGFNK